MRTDSWLAKAGKYQIEHIPVRYATSDVDLSAPPVGVMHTTEGGSWAGLVAEFQNHYAPTFMVGPGRIAQFMPLGKMAYSLEHPSGFPETNRVARVQIEVMGHSSESPYRFDKATEDTLAALMAQLEKDADIPLIRMFPDTMPPAPWAMRSFRRRLSGKWGRTAGWFGHVEVPGNSHWDPGALEWTPLLNKAHLIAYPNPPLPGPIPKPDWFWVWADWKRSGGNAPRPNVPRLIPVWAWRALVAFNKRYPVK